MSVVPTPISVQPKKEFLDFGVYKKMRDRIQRFVVLPFSIRCNSQNSVATADASKKPNQEPLPEPEEKKKKKNGFWFLGLPSKMIKSFRRSISQVVFVYNSNEESETDSEMEIGFPTDVKHLTHIGLDGSTSIKPPPEFISFPTISFRQFELAMAAQAHGHRPVRAASSNHA